MAIRHFITVATIVAALLVPVGSASAQQAVTAHRPALASATAAPEAPANLAPQWTIADRPSSVSNDYTTVQATSDDAIVVDNVLHYGPDYGQTTTPLGTPDQVAIFGSRFVYTYPAADGSLWWVSSNFDGSDRFEKAVIKEGRQRYSNIVLTADGWLEFRYWFSPTGLASALYRVVANVPGALLATPVTNLPETLTTAWRNDDTVLTTTRYSPDAAAFTTATIFLTSVLRFDMADMNIVLVGDANNTVERWRQWDVGAINETTVTLTGRSGPDRIIRRVTADGTTTTWTDGAAGGPVIDLGDRVAWRDYPGWRTAPTGSTESIAIPTPWYAETSVSVIGTTLYAADPRRGVVQVNSDGSDLQTLIASKRFPLTVGAVDVNGGQVVWTDNSAIDDVLTNEFGPQFAVWSRPMTPTGPADLRLVSANANEGLMAQIGTTTFLVTRETGRPLFGVDSDGIATKRADLRYHLNPYLGPVPNRLLAAGGSDTLTIGTEYGGLSGFDLTQNRIIYSAYYDEIFSDDWSAFHTWNEDLAAPAVYAAARRSNPRDTSTERMLLTSGATSRAEVMRLFGSQLVWLSQLGDGTSPVLHWTDLSDIDGIVHTAALEQMGSARSISGKDGWFVINGVDRQGEDLAQLFQFGIGYPRANLTGADTSVNAAVDGTTVAWVVPGSHGAKLVAAPVPTLLPPLRGAGTYVPVEPSRIMDTRFFDAPLSGGETVEIPITGQLAVPTSGVAAVVANVTVTEPSSYGHLAVYPTGGSAPSVSNLNFGAGQSVPNLVTVPLGADGSITISNNSPGSSDVIVDIAGYYLGGTPTTPGAFLPVTPTRVADSRIGLGITTALARDQARDIKVTGAGGVAAARVAAVVANVTVTEPTSYGNLAVYPAGTSTPLVSNLNFAGGQTVANLVTVPVSADGRITVRNSSAGKTQVLIDVAGYYLSGTATAPGAFVAVTPNRIADSRTGLGIPAKLAPAASVPLSVAGTAGVPVTGAAAVVANVTVTEPTAWGNISVYPGPIQPTVSNVNFEAGQSVPNLVAVPLAPDGTLTLANTSPGSSHLIVDVAGYFRGW